MDTENTEEILSLPLDQLKNRISEYKEKGKSLSMDDRLLLRKMIKAADKKEYPVESSKVFVGEQDKEENKLSYIDIDKIFSSHNDESFLDGEIKDRLSVDIDKIKELAASIDEIGLLQPIVIQDMKDGTYRKVTGWRRIEACKLLGRKKIKAIVRTDEFDMKKHNLSIIHENVQRVDLNDYEKVLAVFKLMKNGFSIDDDIEMRKILTQANNLNKNNLKHPTDEMRERLQKVIALIDESKVYSSVSHFVKHLSLLDMDPLIINFLAKGNISFKTAEKLHSSKKLSWISPWEYSSIINAVGEDSLTLEKASSFIAENSTLKTKQSSNIGEIFSKIKKQSKQLTKSDQQILEKEINKLYSKFFQK